MRAALANSDHLKRRLLESVQQGRDDFSEIAQAFYAESPRTQEGY